VPRFQLFNLSEDPGETENVAERHPETLKRLKSQLDQIIASGTRPSR